MKKLITLLTICTLCISTNVYANRCTYIRTVETQCYHWGDWYTQDWHLFKDQNNYLCLAAGREGIEYYHVRKNGYSTFKGKNVSRYKYVCEHRNGIYIFFNYLNNLFRKAVL